jgi:ribose 5-phosphate isomerase A
VAHVALAGSNPKTMPAQAGIVVLPRRKKRWIPAVKIASPDEQKRSAALAALAFLEDGIALGVGTGSTVNHFIEGLRAHRGRIRVAVSSSEGSTVRLRAIGIEPSDLNDVGGLDLYVDGADEANRERHLIKGGGAALTREKIVAGASKRFVCIADESKLVERLGRFPLPVEVIPMARAHVARELMRFNGRAVWRQGVATDNGNPILDVHDLVIDDAVALERELNQIAGVVAVGLFAIRPADLLVVGTREGVREI